MCGRYAITLPPEAMRLFFRYVEQPNFPPRYNVAPTQPVPIVRGQFDQNRAITRHFVLARWGFLPRFVKDPKQFPLIVNARCETLLTKSSFRTAFKRRRCLFIADAFYEWRREAAPNGRRRQAARAYLFHRSDGAPLALGGIWESWMGPNGEELDTACIITTAANGATAAIHERLPAVIEPQSFDVWLDPDDVGAEAAFNLLRPPANDVLSYFEIGPEVNKVDTDTPAVQKPIGSARAQLTPEPQEMERPLQGRLI
jgi:putative SOS response-associated peptidase YedK